MVLYGLLVSNEFGNTFYSKISKIHLNIDEVLFGNFLTSIQSFLKQVNVDEQTGIKSIKIGNFRIIYRCLEKFTFIGLIESKDDISHDELIFEYIIIAFLSIFRDKLEVNDFKTEVYNNFDVFFERYRSASRNKLEKWIKGIYTSYLQELVNNLKDFFPISDLIEINKKCLLSIDNRLIWVAFDTTDKEEIEIFKKLKKITISTFGEKIFQGINNNILEKQKKLKYHIH